MNATPLAVSLRTAADMLDIHEDTLRKAIKAGDLPARKVGSRVRVEVTDLTDWYRKQPAPSAVAGVA